MAGPNSRPEISTILPRIILGGAAFSRQMQANPFDLPSVDLLTKALSHGITAIDTSPYYGPSEIIIGKALSHPDFLSKFPRESYMVCTKVGRIATNTFDYSAKWVRYSVERSLKRLATDTAAPGRTPYLDLVFCHDVEFVSAEEMLEAIGVLIELQKEGKITYIGISSYHPDLLLARVKLVKARYGNVLDAVQSYCHLTLQNSKLAKEFKELKAELGPGKVIINSSPLAMGLLREGGAFGDWHPAPAELNEVCAVKLAKWCQERGKKLANLALCYSVGQMALLERETGGHTIMGPSLPSEVEENFEVLAEIMVDVDHNHGPNGVVKAVDVAKVEKLLPLFAEAREIIGNEWRDYSWQSPPSNWNEIREPNTEKMDEE
ncbi:Aldo/keto reductase family-domain-containing protein [Peziza echinospora]|nr:Aldo/keto reductase family-domain-containing protein [Peziza echinospora]